MRKIKSLGKFRTPETSSRPICDRLIQVKAIGGTCASLQRFPFHHRAFEAAMRTNWPERTSDLNEMLSDLRVGMPAAFKAFSSLAQAATAPNALDGRTKELIALGIAVAIRCDDCIAFHAKAAAKHGATREEVLETLAMAIYMGAGPSVMYASHALEAFGQFNDALAPTA